MILIIFKTNFTKKNKINNSGELGSLLNYNRKKNGFFSYCIQIIIKSINTHFLNSFLRTILWEHGTKKTIYKINKGLELCERILVEMMTKKSEGKLQGLFIEISR